VYHLMHASEVAWRSLEQSAQGNCVRFPNQRLPLGAEPTLATIGIEVDAGGARLLVQRGIQYTGPHAIVRQWLDRGQLVFRSFHALRAWVESDLAHFYAEAVVPSGADPVTPEANSESLVGLDEQFELAEAILAEPRVQLGIAVIGSAGVGKTAFINELARRRAAFGQVVVRLNVADIVAGAGSAADRNVRLHARLTQLARGAANTILLIEDLHFCLGWPEPTWHHEPHARPRRQRLRPDPIGSLLLRTVIDNGVKVCGTMPSAEMPLLNCPQLRRRLEIVRIRRLSDSALLTEVLQSAAEQLQHRCGVQIDSAAIGYSLRKSGNWSQPSAAIRLLLRSALRARQRGLEILGPDDVA
jgi:hypothetical protein